jgi:hypothetical protein
MEHHVVARGKERRKWVLAGAWSVVSLSSPLFKDSIRHVRVDPEAGSKRGNS